MFSVHDTLSTSVIFTWHPMLEDIGNGKLPEWQHEDLSKPHSSKTATRGENYKTQSFKNFMKILLRVHRKKQKI